MSIVFDAAVFDMDGVIFDTERIATDIWIEVAEEDGITNMGETIRRCIGVTQTVSCEIMRAEYGTDFDYYAMNAKVHERLRSRYGGGKLPLKPYVRELLQRLRAEGKRIALATSTRRDVAERELDEAGLLVCFDRIVCGDMVKRSKPAPDIFLTACELLGSDPGRSVGIEDSHNGIRALAAAGMHAIMVPDMLPATEEMHSLAEAIVSDLQEAEIYLFE